MEASQFKGGARKIKTLGMVIIQKVIWVILPNRENPTLCLIRV